MLIAAADIARLLQRERSPLRIANHHVQGVSLPLAEGIADVLPAPDDPADGSVGVFEAHVDQGEPLLPLYSSLERRIPLRYSRWS